MFSHPFLAVLPTVCGVRNDRDLIAFVLRNTPGANGDPDDIRTVQAAVAWWRKFGGDSPFEAYLEPIPVAPDFPALRKEFPMLDLPLLVDPRLGHVRTAQLIGLKYGEYGNTDETLEPADARHTMPTDVPYWVLAHDGTSNVRCGPPSCRDSCPELLRVGTADVLMGIFLQYGPRDHVMDGPGSVLAGSPEYCASVDRVGVNLGLHANRTSNPSPWSGTVVFRPILDASD